MKKAIIGAAHKEFLADCRTIFATADVVALRPTDLTARLCALPESPWATWLQGQPISPRGVAQLLKPFGIKSTNNTRAYGPLGRYYVRDHFEEAWERYVARANTAAEARPSELELDSWPSERRVGDYIESPEGLARIRQTTAGPVVMRLSNFCARITSQLIRDDGAEKIRHLEIETFLNGRRQRFFIPAMDFKGMTWASRELGAAAYLEPGLSVRDHTRAAIQRMSGQDIPERRVFAHLGWTEIGGKHFYLHGAGAIGAEGLRTHIETDLTSYGALQDVVLPEPPKGHALQQAIHASLDVLNLARLSLTAPVYAAIWRASLGAADFSLHLVGSSGTFKTELAALAQNHWGAAFHGKHLPGEWKSTGNALEAAAFAAKDCLFTIDGLAPDGKRRDIDHMHGEAAGLFRAQGNNSGRQRMRPDGTLRPANPPRGLILSTGEDLPRGQGVRARCLIIGVERGDIAPDRLSRAQRDGQGGLYAGVMSAWLQWLAADWEARHAAFLAERDKLRRPAEGAEHPRTPWIVADLGAALRLFLTFATEARALTEPHAAQHFNHAIAAINETAAQQAALTQTRRRAKS